jgi:hypothetical protein
LDINRFRERERGEREREGGRYGWIQVDTGSQTDIAIKVHPKVLTLVTCTEQGIVQLSATKCQIVLLSSKPPQPYLTS